MSASPFSDPLIDLVTRRRSGWSQWFGIGGKPTAQQHEFCLPSTMLPSDTFTIINEYANMAVQVDSILTPSIVMTALPMVATMVMMGTFNMPATLAVKLSRNKSYSVVSGNVPTILGGSPRFGISLGNVFKHKAYVALNAGALGLSGPFYHIIWLQAYGVGFPELVHNSRLTRFYVKHGRVTNVYSDDDFLYVKIHNPDVTFSSDINVGGTITCYGMRTNGFESRSFSFSSINASWHARLAPVKGEENSFIPTIGDFYVLGKAILCDDPQTMYELDLDFYDGFYGTQEQRYKFKPRVIGIWIYDEEETKWTAYVDKENEPLVNLPGNKAQEEIAHEKSKFGGNYAAGISAWRSSSSETIRLIISAKADNLCSGNLIGEYFQLGDEGGNYYEIVDHPRGDTIEIKNKSVSSGSVLFKKVKESADDEDDNEVEDSAPSRIVLYQQKFWKIIEMYTDSSTGGRGGLWEGMIDSVSEGTDGFSYVSWYTKEDNNSRAAITPSQTFPQRFRATADTSGVDADIGYEKYAGWYLISGGDMFPVKTATFITSSSGGAVAVNMTVLGKPPKDMLAIVSMGEPYSTPFAQLGYHNFSAIMRVAIAQETETSGLRSKGQNALFMEGYYDVGYYKLPMPLTTKERLAITSLMYGAETPQYPHVPRVWVATRQPGTSGVCCLEYGTSQKQCVIFKDPDTEMMAFIKADAGWIEGRQKGAIRCGISTTIDASAADKAGEYYALTGMRSKITPSAKDSKKLKGFFVYAPSRESVSDYYTVSIGGQGGIKTPLTIKTGAKIDLTSVSDILLPLEAYEPTPGSSSDISVGTPLALKTKSVDLSLCGFDEVKDNKRFVSLQSQGILPPITPSSIATTFELSKGRQVITNSKQFNAHTCSDGSIIMFYSAETDVFTVGGSGPKNPSKSSVFVIKSNTNMDQWGSPKFDRLTLSQKTGNQDQLDEWERPLMIAYDFEFASSIMLSENRFLIFGYGYARDNGTSSKTTTQHLFLGCYQISLVGLRCGDTHACHLSKASKDDEDISVRFYFRPNHAQPSDSEVYSMKFGQAIQGVPSPTKENKYADSCTERFVRIMGGNKSGVAKSMEMDGFAQDVISPTLSSDGTQFVYFGDYASGTIKRVLSCSGGLTWKQDENADSLATGTCPTAFGDKLFYFDGTSLYCRKLSSDLSPRVVASDVVGHKIAVNTDAQGRTFVFYLNGSGYVRSSVSMDNGLRWESSTNW